MRRAMCVLCCVAASALLVSCGGDDDGAPRLPTADPSTPSDDTTPGNGEAPVADEPASIDPSTMPPAGEAIVEVDGNTFRYSLANSISSVSECTLGEQLLVNFQSDGDDLLIQMNRFGDGWTGAIVATSRTVDRVYIGGNTVPTNAFAVDGRHLVFSGEFFSYTRDDPANQTNVGQGRIAVTCE